MANVSSPPDNPRTANDISAVEAHLKRAIEIRGNLIETLHAEGTNCYRLFHGVTEGAPGLTVDRFGPIVLVQTFRQPLEPQAPAMISEVVQGVVDQPCQVVWNHRGAKQRAAFEEWHDVSIEVETTGREMGLSFDVNPRHQGLDPLLFPDLRAGRRRVRAAADGASVLNLFAYTCGVGVAAMAGGASEVWNVDFAASALAVGRRNAALNDFGGPAFTTIQEDVLPTLRQLAGLPIRGRGKRRPRRHQQFKERRFDLVVLDPPPWAKSAFGAVDLVRDYQSLFKPALIATKEGGHMLLTNNVASVEREEWLQVIERCAAKVGRTLSGIEIIEPEADFPSPDGRPPLKMAWITV